VGTGHSFDLSLWNLVSTTMTVAFTATKIFSPRFFLHVIHIYINIYSCICVFLLFSRYLRIFIIFVLFLFSLHISTCSGINSHLICRLFLLPAVPYVLTLLSGHYYSYHLLICNILLLFIQNSSHSLLFIKFFFLFIVLCWYSLVPGIVYYLIYFHFAVCWLYIIYLYLY